MTRATCQCLQYIVFRFEFRLHSIGMVDEEQYLVKGDAQDCRYFGVGSHNNVHQLLRRLAHWPPSSMVLKGLSCRGLFKWQLQLVGGGQILRWFICVNCGGQDCAFISIGDELEFDWRRWLPRKIYIVEESLPPFGKLCLSLRYAYLAFLNSTKVNVIRNVCTSDVLQYGHYDRSVTWSFAI